MKANKFLSIILMLVIVFGSACILTSCSGDDNDSKTEEGNGNGSTTTIVDGIDISLI